MANDEPGSACNGPLKNRSCTDIPCLMIFVVFMIAWVCVGIYAIRLGNIYVVLNPKDSRGRTCGIDAAVKGKQYSMLLDPTKCIDSFCHSPRVCQSQCPNTTWSFVADKLLQTEENLRKAMICESHVKVSGKSIEHMEKFITAKVCAPWYIKSVPVFGNCIPVPVTEEMIDKITELKSSRYLIDAAGYFGHILNKANSTKFYVCMFILGSIFVTLFYLYLLRWIAVPLIYVGIIALAGLFSLFCYLCYQEYSKVHSKTWLVFSIICAITAGIIVILALCLFQRIRLACRLITEAATAIVHILSTLFFPIIPWLLQFGLVAYFIYAGLLIMSLGTEQFRIEENVKNGNCQCIPPYTSSITAGSACNVTEFYKHCTENGEACISKSCTVHTVYSSSMKVMSAIFMVGAIWCYFFISDLGQMILSGTFTTWYWTFKKSDVPWFPIVTSTKNTVVYHLGTVAFGSFLITLCNLVKLIITGVYNYIQKQNPAGETNACRFVYVCSQCCLNLIEKMIKFINRNAYVICYMRSKGLCRSAAEALSLLAKNFVRTAVLSSVVDLLFFMGTIIVAVGMSALSWWYFHASKLYSNESDTEEDYWLVPVILVGIGSYMVANLFFMVQRTAVNTIFLCALEDCEINNGSKEKPYYMSKKLGKIMGV